MSSGLPYNQNEARIESVEISGGSRPRRASRHRALQHTRGGRLSPVPGSTEAEAASHSAASAARNAWRGAPSSALLLAACRRRPFPFSNSYWPPSPSPSPTAVTPPFLDASPAQGPGPSSRIRIAAGGGNPRNSCGALPPASICGALATPSATSVACPHDGIVSSCAPCNLSWGEAITAAGTRKNDSIFSELQTQIKNKKLTVDVKASSESDPSTWAKKEGLEMKELCRIRRGNKQDGFVRVMVFFHKF
ncbi:uncharacterized protein LOC120667078 [Panicum virgatum]|uniref:uncharacterized protein LOC120667078 n=1 Tax=Panicum virgatum TaxID=38727 RepID=UPI0019D6072A|nr:uncharacterized protein LOC120667078 [Panicum virgatum]